MLFKILKVTVVLACTVFCTTAHTFPIKVTENGIFLPCRIQQQKSFCKFDLGTNDNFLLPKSRTQGKVVGTACFSGDQNNPVCGTEVTIDKLSFPFASYKNVKFIQHNTDLFSTLNFDVLAIIGIGLFDRKVLNIDLKKNQFIVLEKSTEHISHDNSVFFKRQQGKLFVPGKFGGKEVNVMIDLGASISVISDSFYRENHKFFKFNQWMNTLDATGVKKILPLVSYNNADFSCLGLTNQNGQVLVIDLNYIGKMLRIPVDFILGVDLLRDKVLTIDFVGDRITVQYDR